MTPSTNNFSRQALLACSGYLLLCGLSAIVFPVSWLWVARLTTSLSPELELVFSVLGAYLLALSVGAWQASRAPRDHRGTIVVLLASQIFDFLCTSQAVYAGLLGIVPGILFITTTVVWSVILFLCWRDTESLPH